MKLVFFGTPDYVVPIVEALYKEFRTVREKSVIAVVTQPPKPSGRKKLLEYSPIDKWAHGRNIEVLYDYENIPEAELAVVAAYGKIIPEEVINFFPKGVLNVHPSLLPKYRGASPIQAALAAGEPETGLTIIKMDALMDHGPIVSSFREEIKDSDTNETLRDRLFERSVDFLVGLIPNYLNGKTPLKAQDHDKSTFTKLIKNEDGFIESKHLEAALNGIELDEEMKINFIKNYSLVPSAYSLHNFIRALDPWPNAWTRVNISGEQKRLKLIKSHVGNEKLILDEVQLEGKNAISFDELKKGYPSLSL